MIDLCYSNRTERLLQALAEKISAQRNVAHPLVPVELVAPNRNMETWVRLGLGQILGVAANLRFRRLERFIGDIVAEAFPGEFKLIDLDTLEAAVLAVLLDDEVNSRDDLQPVRRYLESTGGVGGAHGEYPAAGSAFSSAFDGSNLANAGALEEKTGAPESSAGTPVSGAAPRIGLDGTGLFDARLLHDGADLRRVQLAVRMAYLFQEYYYSRPEMIASWRGTGGVDYVASPYADPAAADSTLASTASWQRALWRSIFGRGGLLERNPPQEGARWITLDLLYTDKSFIEKIEQTKIPPVHIFGVSYVARLFQHLFALLGKKGILNIYTLNPCAEYWEDVETEREFFLRLDREKNRRAKRIWEQSGETADEDPFGLYEAQNPALRYWGRPGREHVRLLGELTDCVFKSAFAEPAGEGLLHQLQKDILLFEPERTLAEQVSTDPTINTFHAGHASAGQMPDDSVKLIAAPSVRREVEWVADEIWRLMRDDRSEPPLRFSDIAVIVNSAGRDVYLPQIETVFAACHNLPSSVSDLPGTAGSRLIEAMSLLLKLPFGRFSRAEMLNFICHPSVLGRFGDLAPSDLARLAEALGIIFGADHGDHAGTYIDEDVYNWDQGIRRLALGAFMTGEKSDDDRIFETSRGRWLAEEVSASAQVSAARFGLLARALIADARFVANRKMALKDWARFYSAQIKAYLHVEDGNDERDRLRLRRSLAKLEAMDMECEVSGRVAAEIALRAIESLGSGRGQYLAEGVVVSSFLPMRAIPFKVVFLLGLGEGLFPAAGQRDALDLRAAARRAGDVDPSERDRYMFLETLLCTRERFYISYVRRDEQTGDPLEPSAVVQELLHILKNGYLGEQGLKKLCIEPPLRRFDLLQDAGKETFNDEARMEAWVERVAGDWREHVYPDPDRGEEKWLAASPRQSFAEEMNMMRDLVAPETWDKLSTMLGLPGVAPAPFAVTATARAVGAVEGEEEGAVEAPLTLSVSVLRRFLECPMQGWASAMLGLSEGEEDLVDREEEDFEVGRLVETILVRDVFLDALMTGLDAEGLYRERAVRMRLAGKIPVGSPGRVIEKRHLEILSGWQSLFDQFLPGPAGENAVQLSSLRRIRLGRSNRRDKTEEVYDPLALDIPLGGQEGLGTDKPGCKTSDVAGLGTARLFAKASEVATPGTEGSGAVASRPPAPKFEASGFTALETDMPKSATPETATPGSAALGSGVSEIAGPETGVPGAEKPGSDVPDMAAQPVAGSRRMVPVLIGGLTDAVSIDHPLSIILRPGKPPAHKGKAAVVGMIRYFLRGLIDQALLAAAGILGDGERTVVVLYAGGTEETAAFRMRLRPANRQKARQWLATLAEDLLDNSHAYLLPCEAVVSVYYDEAKKAAQGGVKGSIFPVVAEGAGQAIINGAGLRDQVRQMAQDQWKTFSSLWGPVPSPRSYEPPEADEAAGMAVRRFGPLLEEIVSLEVLS